jgi:hypothetical protein
VALDHLEPRPIDELPSPSALEFGFFAFGLPVLSAQVMLFGISI